MTSFYELLTPTSWADPPVRFSFSSLQAIEACPRKWQLLRSEWGAHNRFPQRPHPKALEGSIVHQAIELLVRALGKRGLPSIGSPRFREAIEAIDFWTYFARETEKWNARLAEHPRSGPFFVLRTPPRELANRTIRIFREQYTPHNAAHPPWTATSNRNEPPAEPMQFLRARGALSELALEHPGLPFSGVIDLVELVDGKVRVVDFKTGKCKNEHELQLRLYALLWWRRTGSCPTRLVLQYLNRRHEFAVEEQDLIRTEERLAAAIVRARQLLARQPAEARPSDDCCYCPVRARCATGWRIHRTVLGRNRTGRTDVELVVAAAPSSSGFIATASGREVNVVYDAAVGLLLPTYNVGERLRLLDVIAREQGSTFEARPWTEVYRVSGQA